MVSKTVARNATQKFPEIEINDRIVLQPHVWYTCPAGKKAIVKGRVQCTGTGAAAQANFNVGGLIMFRWIPAAFTQNWEDSPRTLSDSAEQFAFFDVEISAGETIETTQDVGTNAEFNLWAKVQESAI